MAKGAVIIRGGQPVKWGTDGLMPQGTIVQTYSTSKSVETHDILNNVGNVCSVVVYDKKQEITIEVVYNPNDSEQPEPGEVIEVGSGSDTAKALVATVELSYSQDDVAVLKITANQWENVDLTLEQIQGETTPTP